MPRKYPALQSTPCTGWQRFNEAGADAPEIPLKRAQRLRAPAGFNEAGADAPEIPILQIGFFRTEERASMRPGRMPRKYLQIPFQSFSDQRCFNEAGADAPEIPSASGPLQMLGQRASMRPGRMPRKYPFISSSIPSTPACFNEAGADAPEIPYRPWLG